MDIDPRPGAWRRTPRWVKAIGVPMLLLALLYAAVAVSVSPDDSFWVERADAEMPVWVRGNVDSGVFVVFNHGGPGSVGTLESMLEVSPGDGVLGGPSPIASLEERYAVVYWDQRHAGMSRGDVDPNTSTPDDFGRDLAVVVAELDARYDVERLFLIGQSWGHTVATSYLTSVDGWAEHQERVDGYVAYKGNHELPQAYGVARERILAHAEQQLAAGVDVATWQEAVEFYTARPVLTEPADLPWHFAYADMVMGVSISIGDRIGSSVRASLFSPFNGLRHFANNRATMQAEDFLTRVITDTSLTDVVPRIEVPTLLVYGRNDLVAPVEVGETILDRIGTPQDEARLLVLEESRHGAEGDDVERFRSALVDFIESRR